MSHTNNTPNYQLPQFLSTDKPAWMGDINQAFSNIDTAMHNNAEAAADNAADIGVLETTVNDPTTGLVNRMATAETNVTALQNTTATNSANIATLTTAVAMEGKTYSGVSTTSNKSTPVGTIIFETFTAPDNDITYSNGVFTVNKNIKTLMLCVHMVATPANNDNQLFIELFKNSVKEYDTIGVGAFVTLDTTKVFTDVPAGTTFHVNNVKPVTINASGTWPAYVELVVLHG